jgi:hypothetical protein
MPLITRRSAFGRDAALHDIPVVFIALSQSNIGGERAARDVTPACAV